MALNRAEFLVNCWYVAAWSHELNDGRLLARTILGEPVLLYKGDSGKVTALEAGTLKGELVAKNQKGEDVLKAATFEAKLPEGVR